MKKLGLALLGAAGLVAALAGGPANAVPVCTGGTLSAPAGIGGPFTASDLATNVCVQAGDKLFGTFTFGNLPSNATVSFNFTAIPGGDHHDISFNANFASGTHYTGFGYDVAIFPLDPANSITDLFSDFTQSTGGPSTLTKTSTPAGTGSVNMTKTGPVCAAPCNNHISYGNPGVTELLVAEDLNVATGAQVSSILNTIIEARNTSTPEPASLALLGTALVGFGVFRRRRNAR